MGRRCDVWQDRWDGLRPDARATIKARQGVRGPMLEAIMVADPATLVPVPKDGETIGEIFMRGNNVFSGYLKNPGATAEAFAGGWFHTGDLAVWHPDGYVEIKDRSKDIIISGGENISSIEVEDVLYRHPDVLEAAVVARPDEKWGETPCAFLLLKPGATASEAEIIAFCREPSRRLQGAAFGGLRAAAAHPDRQGAEVRAPRRRARALGAAGGWPIRHASRADFRLAPGQGLVFPGELGISRSNEWLTLFARRLMKGMGVAGDLARDDATFDVAHRGDVR